MEATALKLRYRSIDQFAEHCRQLKSGRMFIPTEMPLPAQTRLLLALILPDAPRRITLEMEVLEAVDRKSGAALKKPCGMLLGPAGELDAALKTLAQEIRAIPGLAAALAGRPGTGGSPPVDGTTLPPPPSGAPARSAEPAPDASSRPPEDAAFEIVDKLFSRLHAEPPEDKELAARHYRRVTQIIQTVGGMKSFKDRDRVEAAVLEVAQKAAGHKKGILQRIRKSGDPEEAKVLTAAISALGAMGTARSEPFLAKIAADKTPHAAVAAKALEALRTRSATGQ